MRTWKSTNPCLNSGNCVCVLFLEVILAWPCGFSPNTGTDWHSVKGSRGPHVNFWFLLYTSSSFHVLYVTWMPWTPQIYVFDSSTQQDNQVLFAFCLLALKPSKFFSAEILANGRSPFISFLLLRKNSLALLVVQCQKIPIFYILSIFLVIYDGMIVLDAPNVAF